MRQLSIMEDERHRHFFLRRAGTRGTEAMEVADHGDGVGEVTLGVTETRSSALALHYVLWNIGFVLRVLPRLQGMHRWLSGSYRRGRLMLHFRQRQLTAMCLFQAWRAIGP